MRTLSKWDTAAVRFSQHISDDSSSGKRHPCKLNEKNDRVYFCKSWGKHVTSCLVITRHSWNEMNNICWHFAKEHFLLFFSFTSYTCSALKSFLLIQKWFSICAFSPRDLPVFCEWGHGLRLRSRLVVTRGDDLWSTARMGKASLEVFIAASSPNRIGLDTPRPLSLPHRCIFPLLVIVFPHQRPYDIHASNSVESLIQLFSTVSVQYSPAWPKALVSLLRKVRQTRPGTIRFQRFHLISWIYFII